MTDTDRNRVVLGVDLAPQILRLSLSMEGGKSISDSLSDPNRCVGQRQL